MPKTVKPTKPPNDCSSSLEAAMTPLEKSIAIAITTEMPMSRFTRGIRVSEVTPPQFGAAAPDPPPRVARAGSIDVHRGADRHQPREREDVVVAHADAAVRDAPGQQIRPV